MLLQRLRSALSKVEAVFEWSEGCRGVFRVADETGMQFGDVVVGYRMGKGDCMPCGHSRDEGTVIITEKV